MLLTNSTRQKKLCRKLNLLNLNSIIFTVNIYSKLMSLNIQRHLDHWSILERSITLKMFLALSLRSTSHSPSPPEKLLISFALSLTSTSLIKLSSTTPRLLHSIATSLILNLKAPLTKPPPAMKLISKSLESLPSYSYSYHQKALKLLLTTSLTRVILKMPSSPCVKLPELLSRNKR